MKRWEFDGTRLFFTPEKDAKGWYMDGFLLKNDLTDDLREEYGLCLQLEKGKEPTLIRVSGTGYMNRDQLNEEMIVNPVLEVAVPAGTEEIILPFQDFQFLQGQQLFWGYFTEFVFTTQAVIRDAFIVGGDPLRVACPVKSRYKKKGEIAEYQIQLENCSPQSVSVQIKQELYGWETCVASWGDPLFMLEAGEKKVIFVQVVVGRQMVPGGRETQKLVIVPDGQYRKKQEITLITGCEVAHPHLIHTKEGWEQVRRKVEQYEWASRDFARYIEIADAWQPKRIENGYVSTAEDQNFKNGFIETLHSEYAMNTAVAYAVTGRREYAEKCVKLIRIFLAEYPERKQACNQALVQEGHFFQHLAMACDVIWNSGLLSEEEKGRLEVCFRIYMDIVDKELYLGGISNHYLAEIVGCLACAMLLQDAERIERFLYGQGGMMIHLAKGVFDDGWYYECSLGYNLWVLVLYLQTGLALEKMGYYVLDEKVPAYYSDHLNIHKEELYGIRMDQWGGRSLNYRNIEMMLDALMPYADYRGIIFAMNDAQDQGIFERRHGFRPYDLAYAIYQKPEYGYLASLAEVRDCIYGAAELPEFDGSVLYSPSVYSENAGYAVLRSQKGPERERIQAVMRYGSHGGYHGHFDRLDLVSLMRYGKSFYFPEIIWYGYGSYLYKFLVQNSITHNMVVVDGKNQEAVPAEQLLFYGGEHMQVSSARVAARWANPPYGGMRYGVDQSFEEKALEEGRTFNFPEKPPAYGEITGYTEPVEQIRTMVVTDDYVLLHDVLRGEETHTYDYMFHPQALREIYGAKKTGHRKQMDENPLSSGQFITDCDVYQAGAEAQSARLFFDMDLNADPAEASRRCHGEDGELKMDLYLLNAEESEIIVGRTPVNRSVHKKLHYELWQDGRLLTAGDTGAWILGAVALETPVTGGGAMELRIKADKFKDTSEDADNTLYMADARIEGGGKILAVSELALSRRNTCAADKEEIIMEGEHYRDFICLTPQDYSEEAVVSWEATGLEGTFRCVIGCDYPPKVSDQERKSIAFRKKGREAEFFTLIELYEQERKVKEVILNHETGSVSIQMNDGSEQEILFLQDGQHNVKYHSRDREKRRVSEESTI